MPNEDGGYSTVTGLVYVFNLIVGTGALALPGAFEGAGWLLSTAVVAVLGLLSYVTVTFVLETLSVVNAMGSKQPQASRSYGEEDDEGAPLVQVGQPAQEDSISISHKFEISEMACILLAKPARVFVYSSLILYLFGDLTIYAAVVGRTLSHVTCTYRPADYNCSYELGDNIRCWERHQLSRATAHRIYVCLFVALIGPFVFFNIQKTKWLQLVMSGMRCLAFTVMIIWSIKKLVTGGKKGSPDVVNLYGMPALFGTSIYAFMCQHSIPGLIQPIADKSSLRKLFPVDYLLISLFYILLSLTAVFAFSHVEDLYTLNFWADQCSPKSSMSVLFLDYYLALFPVFTLSTSFPIVAITLKNNIRKVLFDPEAQPHAAIDKFAVPAAAILVPTTLALAVADVQLLVGVVGSYAGAAVQYLIPCVLVTAARAQDLPLDCPNPFASPFCAKGWVIFLYAWTAVSLVFITANHVTALI